MPKAFGNWPSRSKAVSTPSPPLPLIRLGWKARPATLYLCKSRSTPRSSTWVSSPPSPRPGQTIDLWATSRGDNHPDGPPTASVHVTLPDTSHLSLAETSPGLIDTWTTLWHIDLQTPHGPHALTFRGTDTANLEGSAKSALFIDAVPPDAPLLTQPLGHTYTAQDTAPLSGLAEPLGTVLLYVNGAPIQTVTADANGTWSAVLPLTEGDNIIQATVQDFAGNESLPSLLVTVTRDTTPPQLTGWALDPFIQTDTLLTLQAAITDTSPIATAAVSLADQPAVSLFPLNDLWQTTQSVNLPEGIHLLTFSATDYVGNTNTATNTLTIDNTPPTLDLTLTADPSYTVINDLTLFYGQGTGTFTITAITTDTLAGLDTLIFPDATSPGTQFTIHNSPFTIHHSYTFNLADTASGPFTVSSQDRADNIAQVVFTLQAYQTDPDIALNVMPDGLFLQIAWAVTDTIVGLQTLPTRNPTPRRRVDAPVQRLHRTDQLSGH